MPRNKKIFGKKKAKKGKNKLSKPKKNNYKKNKKVTLRQKRKKLYSINVNPKKKRLRKYKTLQKPMFKSMTFTDSSMFRSGTHIKPRFKRNVSYDENNQGKHTGFKLIQDNNDVYVSRLP